MFISKTAGRAPRRTVETSNEPLLLLQAILDHADLIGFGGPKRGRQIHLLLTLPVELLDHVVAVADADADYEPDGDAEPSLVPVGTYSQQSSDYSRGYPVDGEQDVIYERDPRDHAIRKKLRAARAA